MKIYKSKTGLQFRITQTNQPSTDGIVNWTQEEFQYIKDKGFSPEQYKVIHALKLDNYLYSPITPEDLNTAAKLATHYVGLISEPLKKHSLEPIPEDINQHWEPNLPDWEAIWKEFKASEGALQAIKRAERGYSGSW